MRPAHTRPRLRWWPALAVLLLAAVTLLWIWLAPAESRQLRVMRSMTAAAGTFVLLVLWLLLASGLRAWQRLAIFAAVAAVAGFLALSLEVRELSGDVVPRVAFKWTERPDARLPAEIPATDAAPVADAATDGRDFPQFLGPRRNATVPHVRLATDWQAAPPALLWRRDIGAGNSGFAIARGIAVTEEQRGDQEMVVAYDLESGSPRWAHGATTRHASPLSGDGPCATPAIAGGTVFAVGATGRLTALDLSSGAERWSRDVLRDAGADKPVYGLCASPLVIGDQVVVVAGGRGALRAYDAATGAPRWSGGSYAAAYSSPALITLAGTPQIVVFHGAGPDGDLTGHGLDGTPLWHLPWPPVERTSQPVALPGDRIFVSSGYGVGAKVFRVRQQDGRFTAETVWESASLKAKLTQVVYKDGFLYGLDDGILVAVDAETGARAWKRGRYGHGQVLLVGEVILVVSEQGEVALVDASPEAYRELGSFQAIAGRTWNTPALAGPYLVVRNTQQAACYRLPLREG